MNTFKTYLSESYLIIKKGDIIKLEDIKFANWKDVIKSDDYEVLGIKDDILLVKNIKTHEKITVVKSMVKEVK